MLIRFTSRTARARSLHFEESRTPGSRSPGESDISRTPSSFASLPESVLPHPALLLNQLSQDAMLQQIAELTRQNRMIQDQLGHSHASPTPCSDRGVSPTAEPRPTPQVTLLRTVNLLYIFIVIHITSIHCICIKMCVFILAVCGCGRFIRQAPGGQTSGAEQTECSSQDKTAGAYRAAETKHISQHLSIHLPHTPTLHQSSHRFVCVLYKNIFI